MRRPRGPGGRFLTADEVAALEERGNVTRENGTSAIKKIENLTSGTKRKAGAIGNKTLVKKNKITSGSAEEDDDGDGEEDLN